MPRGRKKSKRVKTRRFAAQNINREIAPIRDKYHFQRTYLQNTIQVVAGSPYLSIVSLNVASMPTNLKTFIGFYDLLRINYVQVRWMPRWAVNAAGPINDEELPQIVIVPNYDDFNIPSSVDSILGQGNAQMLRFTRTVTKRFHPHTLLPQNVSAGSPPNVLLAPTHSWFNSAVFNASFSSYFPMAKYGITATTACPGNGYVDIYLTVDLTLAQHLSG